MLCIAMQIEVAQCPAVPRPGRISQRFLSSNIFPFLARNKVGLQTLAHKRYTNAFSALLPSQSVQWTFLLLPLLLSPQGWITTGSALVGSPFLDLLGIHREVHVQAFGSQVNSCSEARAGGMLG